jgi:hypothetical protein
MAIRSGGGTGVLVALVVFVLLFVFSTVMTIVFYVGKNDAEQRANTAEANLKDFINPAQQQSEEAKQMKAAANTERKSVYEFLMTRHGDLAAWVGNRGADLTGLQGEIGVGKDKTVKDVVADLRRQLKAKSDEANALTSTVSSVKKDLASAKDEAETARKEGNQKVDAVNQEVAGYKQASETLRQQVGDAVTNIDKQKAEMESRFRSRESELQTEIDTLRAEDAVKNSRLLAMEDKLRAIEVKPANPAELVDGRIIAVEGAGDTLFINIGSRDRVVPGMTFEVFEDANAIQAADRSGLNRGKASIQVMRVGDTTSTGKVTRSSPGRPIVKDDVIANAVFSKDYKFKFLVHGKFDVDGDGRPSDTEADYLRSQIRKWGGEVIVGDELTGDLDFVVLGVKPIMPPSPPDNATEAELQALLEARNAVETYERLFNQSVNARIPVLNWNRFQVLTGTSNGN